MNSAINIESVFGFSSPQHSCIHSVPLAATMMFQLDCLPYCRPHSPLQGYWRTVEVTSVEWYPSHYGVFPSNSRSLWEDWSGYCGSTLSGHAFIASLLPAYEDASGSSSGKCDREWGRVGPDAETLLKDAPIGSPLPFLRIVFFWLSTSSKSKWQTF